MRDVGDREHVVRLNAQRSARGGGAYVRHCGSSSTWGVLRRLRRSAAHTAEAGFRTAARHCLWSRGRGGGCGAAGHGRGGPSALDKRRGGCPKRRHVLHPSTPRGMCVDRPGHGRVAQIRTYRGILIFALGVLNFIEAKWLPRHPKHGKVVLFLRFFPAEFSFAELFG